MIRRYALAAAAALALALAASGCVTRTQVESAALAMPWPRPPAEILGAYAAPSPDYPTVGGDILKGASPADQAKARAAAVPPLEPPAKP